jgi:hypothetical protein
MVQSPAQTLPTSEHFSFTGMLKRG